MVRLSVNLNKVALLRNSRHTGVPSLARFASLCLTSGADGLTVHPRPDERHIRRSDVHELAALMQPMRPDRELNIEGRPTEDFLALVAQTRPEQCTLVPDAPDAFTSETGWNLAREGATAQAAVQQLKALGVRAILFMDPDADAMAAAKAIGADGVEIYTGTYASAFRAGNPAAALRACLAAAEAARALDLIVNGGHDLNARNLPPLMACSAWREFSIGHELTADALAEGFPAAIAAYKTALTPSGATVER
jgi:pyridoxine 5-phosphate synthase